MRPELNLLASLFASTLTLLACAPQGEWKRVLHAPHQTFMEQTQTGSPTADGKTDASEGEGQGFQRGRSGLPDHCKRSAKIHGSICLDCRPGPWLVQRCYEFAGKFVPETACQSNADRLKCLMSQPVTPINLALKRSVEREFRENYLTWEAKVLEIWQSRLPPTQQEALTALLHLTGELSLWFSQRDPAAMQDADWLGLLPLAPEDAHKAIPRCRQMASQLQSIRLKGDLTLLSFLRSVKALLNDAKVEQHYLEYLDALSLEGLEEGY